MRKTLSRFSPTGGSKKSAEEAEKRARQLRERNEENAIMQEVCQDIGGRLAGTVNIMEALQEEIEIRTAQSDRDKVRIRSLEDALEKTGKASLLREKDELVQKIKDLEARSEDQLYELSLAREHSQVKDSAALYHKSKAESLSQALELRATGSDGMGASKAEEDLRRVSSEKDALTRRLHEVEERLLEANVKCKDLAEQLAGSRDLCKKFESEAKAVRDDLASVQEELRLSSLDGNEFAREFESHRERVEEGLREKYAALERAAEDRIKSTEQRSLDLERRAEELESLSERQSIQISTLQRGSEEKQRSIGMLNQNIASLEDSLGEMSRSGSALADELEGRDAQIKELTRQVEELSRRLVSEQAASPALAAEVSPPPFLRPQARIAEALTGTKPALSDRGYLANLEEIERLAFEREDQLEDCEASLHSRELGEAIAGARLKEVQAERDNLRHRLGEANGLLQETRVQLRALDTEADRLRQSLASSRRLQEEQVGLVAKLRDAAASYSEKMKESDARVELMRVEMQGLSELAEALNGDVVEKAASLDEARSQLEAMKQELVGGHKEKHGLREAVSKLERDARAARDELDQKSAELLSAEQMISFLEMETESLREQLLISETNTNDSDSAAGELRARIARLQEERDSLCEELDEAEKIAMEEAEHTRENTQRVELYSKTLEGMQGQVNRLQAEADALRDQVASYKQALDAKKTPEKGQAQTQAEVSPDVSRERTLNDVTIAMKEMLENKIDQMSGEIEALAESRDAILRDKKDFLLEIDGLLVVTEAEEEAGSPQASLEAKVHRKISSLVEDYSRLRTAFDDLQAAGAEGADESPKSPSLSELKSINRDIDNLSRENDRLREDLYLKEKSYSEAAERNVELLSKLGALESEEESARAKMDALRERHERVQGQNESAITALREGKADLEERLGAEAGKRLALEEENGELRKEASDQKDRRKALEVEKAALLDRVAELETKFSEQERRGDEDSRALRDSRVALDRVKAQLNQSLDGQAEFVATLRGEYADFEKTLISAREESHQVVGEMMLNFESVLQQARQDCQAVSNELIETVSEARSLRVLSEFNASLRGRAPRPANGASEAGALGTRVRSQEPAQSRQNDTGSLADSDTCVLYDENTPLRTPEANMMGAQGGGTPYTRIENILLDRPARGRGQNAAPSVLKDLNSTLEGRLSDEIAGKIERAVSKQISGLGLERAASQFEMAAAALDAARDQFAARQSDQAPHLGSAKVRRRRGRESSSSRARQHDREVHWRPVPATRGQTKLSPGMEKLTALQDRLGKVEDKYRSYVESDAANVGSHRRRRTDAIATRIAGQRETVKEIECKLRRRAEVAAETERGGGREQLSPEQKEVMSALTSSGGLEQEVRRSKKAWSGDYIGLERLPAGFVGKKVLEDSACSVERNRLDRLRSEMEKFKDKMSDGEAQLTELEAHALRARQIIAEAQRGPGFGFAL